MRLATLSPALVALVALVALMTVLGAASAASAFCGFYVSGADASLYTNATMVVMMRDGTRTVLSMQNDYQGPPEDFAMVVPVPTVLQEADVKTLPREVFGRVDTLAAPRLVEYWEVDPCLEHAPLDFLLRGGAAISSAEDVLDGHGVTIEAQFSVGEYDIVVLSAEDSGGLDAWLREENYNIPAGAEPVLRPYVEQGTKFFVAKVAAERVTFENGRAVLSPLRFHYDAREFSLPVRLGLLNSAGQQDLIVHILARGQRYEVANYENATIPTNLIVKDEVRWGFGDLYDLIFQRTLARNPRAVVTEYSWDASTCDPCPVPALTGEELRTLGADVLPGGPNGFVLTRLHYRYGPEGLDEDLVFRAAPPIVGGRGVPNTEGQLSEEGAQPGSINNFQGRYAILHPWEGEVGCEDPNRGLWGRPPGEPGPVWGAPNPRLGAAGDGAATEAPDRPEGLPPITSIGLVVEQDVPAIGVVAGRAETVDSNEPGRGTEATPTEGGDRPAPPAARSGGGCASCAVGGRGGRGGRGGGLGALVGLGLLVMGLTLRARRG